MVHRVRSMHKFRTLSKPKKIPKNEYRHYLPFIPVFLLIMSTFIVALYKPTIRNGVLAYATSMDSSQLLDATNYQREKAKAPSLKLNSNLTKAAQAKANDMVARNYWSHNTPDGKEPWVFIKNAGYDYLRAGENLAYGFSNGENTINGWMNSPTHKENMLNSNFIEVGFGYANSEDFNGSGPETIVVAMYGTPQVLSAGSSNSPIPTKTTIAAPQPAKNEQPQSTPYISANATLPVTTDTAVVEPVTIPIARVQSIASGTALPWALYATGIITGLAMSLLLIKYAVSLRHLVRDSEKFILHHPLYDTLLVAVILLGTILSQTTGFIK